MSEGKKAMSNLVFLHKVFVICLIVYVITASICGMVLLKEIFVFTRCESLYGGDFNVCYVAAKR